MFFQEGFWKQIIFYILLLSVFYFLIREFIFKKQVEGNRKNFIFTNIVFVIVPTALLMVLQALLVNEMWSFIALYLARFLVVFFLVNLILVLLKRNLDQKKSMLINLMLAFGILFLFSSIYNLIPEILNAGQFFTQNIIQSLLYVSVLSLATTGIVLIFKTSNTTNFAQGMIATIGAFLAAKLVLHFTTTYTEMTNTTMVALAMLGGALVAFLVGLFIDAVIIRNSKLPTPVGKQMITMGLVLIITGLIPIVFGTVPLSVPRILYGDNVEFVLFGFDLTIPPHYLVAMIVTVVLLVVVFSMLRFTKWGLGVRATASNEVVANMMGVNTKLITALSWGIAGFLGAVAAVFWAPAASSTLGVALMVPTQVNGFMAAILGSFSSFAGPLIASIIIPILTALLTLVNVGWENAIVYAIILVIVLVKPAGLFGKKVAKKV